MLTKEQIEAIRNRADKATAGPWIDNGNEIVSPQDLKRGIAGAISDEDSDFIAQARQDIPMLLDYITELESALNRIVDGDCDSLGDAWRIAREALK
jgi:hypothetical protein